MEHHTHNHKIGMVLVVAGAALLAPADSSASSAKRYLCTSSPSACEHAGPGAPVLDADVCWDGREALLRGAGPCPQGSWPYFVLHGEVLDVETGLVQAYIELDDACAHPGICVTGKLSSELFEDAICCSPSEGCVEHGWSDICYDDLYWCIYGESNEDGTVTCHDDEQLP